MGFKFGIIFIKYVMGGGIEDEMECNSTGYTYHALITCQKRVVRPEKVNCMPDSIP